MKIIFLDIDGVLNNCQAISVFHESSTKSLCIEILNFIIQETGSKVIIISSWKDNFDFQNTIKPMLYKRGIMPESIIGCTEKDVVKELGIMKYLAENSVDNFVIVDDALECADSDLVARYVQTNTHTGLVPEDIDKIINVLGI